MATEYVRLESTDKANIIVLRLPGSLDAIEFDGLNESIMALLTPGKLKSKWIIDLAAVSYMGSAMLGMLVNVRQRVKAGGGELFLCGLSKPLMTIFRTCCMERLFNIVKDRQHALDA